MSTLAGVSGLLGCLVLLLAAVKVMSLSIETLIFIAAFSIVCFMFMMQKD